MTDRGALRVAAVEEDDDPPLELDRRLVDGPGDPEGLELLGQDEILLGLEHVDGRADVLERQAQGRERSERVAVRMGVRREEHSRRVTERGDDLVGVGHRAQRRGSFGGVGASSRLRSASSRTARRAESSK